MWKEDTNPDPVTHSRENALNEREFELLMDGAKRIDDRERSVQAQFEIIMGGRLGLRVGEIAHIESEWVDREKKRIQIPAHCECTHGRDGGRCGQCRQYIKQCAAYNDIPYADAAESWWRPKSPASVRAVPYEWSARADYLISRIFDDFEYELYRPSRTSIDRHVTAAAELADGLDPDSVHPHCLRATAATHLSGLGLPAEAMCAMLGWVQIDTAEKYLASSDSNLKRALRRVHSL